MPHELVNFHYYLGRKRKTKKDGFRYSKYKTKSKIKNEGTSTFIVIVNFAGFLSFLRSVGLTYHIVAM